MRLIRRVFAATLSILLGFAILARSVDACPLPCVYVEVEEPPGWVRVCPPV